MVVHKGEMCRNVPVTGAGMLQVPHLGSTGLASALNAEGDKVTLACRTAAHSQG